MLSVIIPSYKDPLLHKTIDDILRKSIKEIEIIPVIDGYTLTESIRSDSRIRPVYLRDNVGMREAINIGVSHAKGEYLMRTDEHCMFSSGFDNIITSNIEDNWIVDAIRYKLDADKFEVTDDKPIGYEKLIIDSKRNKFASVPWKNRDKERKDKIIDETMAMQGSFWVMTKHHWNNVIRRLDSRGYGTHYQDSVEMLFKTWQSGGKLMLNKNVWYAHKHRKFKRTHNYSRKLADASFKHSLDTWKVYYEHTIKKRWGI